MTGAELLYTQVLQFAHVRGSSSGTRDPRVFELYTRRLFCRPETDAEAHAAVHYGRYGCEYPISKVIAGSVQRLDCGMFNQ